jgi:sugar lactone lactonase YvrE
MTKPVTSARDIHLDMGAINSLVFVEGMAGPEGIFADPKSEQIFVTDCSGMIYVLDGKDRASLKVAKSKKIAGASAIGVTVGPDDLLYVGIAENDWMAEGGYVARMSKTLENKEVLTEVYEGLNGMDFSPDGDLYFASSNMSYKQSKGRIMKLSLAETGAEPELAIGDLGAANGVAFNPEDGRLYYTEVFQGLSAFDLKTEEKELVLGKADTFEFFDDICIDGEGRVWSTAAGGFIKTWDPKTGTSVRFHMEGIGSTSACAIRVENGEEIIYITELKKPGNKPKSRLYDGRGMISFPLSVLSVHL